ncbi:DsrE family protein [Maribacter sp. ANRC-HE7]|uniref:DsrE family protein n=1 Tax=Maribacter aquimaris TaxID=2737171 RepID=A0ABR7UVK0_9FLAO|nr:DsrE family protein [Maribacter aquimaris]MBD0776474.1 DsrE family protein [Maribacter aquimaris]
MPQFNPIPLFLGFILSLSLGAQSKKAGPIISDFGEVWTINAPDFKTDTSMDFKAVFDIMNSPDDPSKLNTTIETAARFLNMHAQNSVPVEQLKVALVIHNKASKDIITNKAYRTRYGTDNPNIELIKALLASGGQSSMARGIAKEELIDGVQLSLSAMTALIQFQNNDYKLIKF